MAPQVVKHFLGEGDPSASNIVPSQSNTSVENQKELSLTVPPGHPNSTESISFQSNIQQVFLIEGVLFLVAALLHVLCVLFSGCKLQHIIDKEVQVKVDSSKGTSYQKPRCFHLFVSIMLLCFLTFFGSAAEYSFAALVVPFCVKMLNWTKSYASNLISLFWAFFMVSQLATAILSKFLQMKIIMVASIALAFFSPIFVTFTVQLTSASLWLGTVILALGVGNLLGAVISMGKNITSRTGILSSLVFASTFGARMSAPILAGYVLDNLDPMWFLYICIMYSSSAVISLALYLTVQFCCSPQNEQKKDVEEEEMDDMNI